MSQPKEPLIPMDFSLDYLVQWVLRTRDVDLCSYDLPFLYRQVRERLDSNGLSSVDDYLRLLKAAPEEVDLLLNQIGITHTRFFRDPQVFEAIAGLVVPTLFQPLRDGKRSELRVWCAGCATGEEAYSIALLLREEMRLSGVTGAMQIFATDIDQPSLAMATKGRYRRDQLADTRLGLIDRYFTPHGAEFQLNAQVREMVDFSCEDLARKDFSAPAASIFGGFDLILCRNLLIYFKQSQRIAMAKKLVEALSPGGYLVLGRTETLMPDISPMMTSIDPDLQIYQRC